VLIFGIKGIFSFLDPVWEGKENIDHDFITKFDLK